MSLTTIEERFSFFNDYLHLGKVSIKKNKILQCYILSLVILLQ